MFTCHDYGFMRQLRFRYQYRRKLPHFQSNGNGYFLTSSVKRHPDSGLPIIYPYALSDDRIAVKVMQTIKHFDRKMYHLDACVIMPDHLHMLIHPAVQMDTSVSLTHIMHTIKRITARRVNRVRHAEGSIWQQEYYDRRIRSEEDRSRVLQYIYENPLHRGLVSDPEEWQWMYFCE